jgi:hypothetical protein
MVNQQYQGHLNYLTVKVDISFRHIALLAILFAILSGLPLAIFDTSFETHSSCQIYGSK